MASSAMSSMDLLPEISGANFSLSAARISSSLVSSIANRSSGILHLLDFFPNLAADGTLKGNEQFALHRLWSHGLYRRVDTAISSTVFAALNCIGIEMRPEPLTYELPFVSSPTPVVLSIIAYLIVVLGWAAWIRAKDLKPRQEDPWMLRIVVVLHNLFLCGLSMYMGFGMLYQAWKNNYSILGNAMDNPAKPQLAYLIYTFYISKLYEFVDTLIMLQKRSLRQVTWLHIYHHASISFIWWLLCFQHPGGDTYFSAMLNSLIHVAMYAYYLLAATIAKDEKRRRKYLFWGKYLTILQMIQFTLFMGQAIYGLYRHDIYPRGTCELLFMYSLSLLLFFANFFIKKHISGANKPSQRPKVAKQE